MSEKLIRQWKKVFENDLSYVVYELKEIVTAPAVLILNGEMGSGKTTFTKEFIADGETTSPSYSIISETSKCLHADLDRIENREDLLHLELGLHLDGKSYFIVEWGKKYLDALEREVPENFKFYQVDLEVNPESDASASSRNYSLFELDL